MTRPITRRYEDPLDRIWRGCAGRIGFTISRSSEAYASTDGQGVMLIGTPDTLDTDDCLAQIIFHEFCHALVEGDAALTRRDWGLDNRTDRDVAREHACLRVQAVLATRHGLKAFLAPTTDYRAFWDALESDPMTSCAGAQRRLVLDALSRAERAPFAPHLDAALRATAQIVAIARPFGEGSAGDDSLFTAT